jgi:hypothetical protein
VKIDGVDRPEHPAFRRTMYSAVVMFPTQFCYCASYAASYLGRMAGHGILIDAVRSLAGSHICREGFWGDCVMGNG